jgi:hypothetical protein
MLDLDPPAACVLGHVAPAGVVTDFDTDPSRPGSPGSS